MIMGASMGELMIGALLALVLPAAIFDLRSRRIPNGLSLAGMLMGLTLHVIHAGLPGVGESLAGLLIALVVGFFFFAIGWLGAGDAKLVAAIGAIVGLSQTLEFMFWIAMSGGVVAMVALMWHGQLLGMLKRFWATLALSIAARRWVYVPPTGVEAVEIPYAVSIAIGALVAVVLGKVWLV